MYHLSREREIENRSTSRIIFEIAVRVRIDISRSSILVHEICILLLDVLLATKI